MVARIEFFTIDYSLTNLIPEETPASSNCYDWNVTQKYQFSDRGYITLTLNIDRKVCTTAQDN